MSDIDKVTEERDRARGEIMNLQAKIQELESRCDTCNVWGIAMGRNLKLQEEWEAKQSTEQLEGSRKKDRVKE